MGQQINIPGLDVHALGEQFELPDLRNILVAHDVRLITFGEQEIVLDPDWRNFVRMAIHHIEECDKRRPQHVDQPVDGLEESGWSPGMQNRLQLNPWLAKLLEAFETYVRAHEPEVQVIQNKGTKTYVLANGGSAGLRLKPRQSGLRLSAQRNKKTLEHYVKSADEFEKALAWLRDLPAY